MPETYPRNSVAVVTGASRGIGRAIAVELARKGSTVIVTARSEHASASQQGTIHETVQQIESEGGKALAIKTDVSSHTQVSDMVDQVMQRFGRIDLLVNNAGILGSDLPFIQTDIETWDKIIGVNLSGSFYCAIAVTPHMIQQGHGLIANITSGAATRTGILNAPYGISKAGLYRLTLAISDELRDYGIACVSLSPQGTDTDTARGISWREGPPRLRPPEWTAWTLLEIMRDGPMKYTGQVLTVQPFLAERGMV